MILLSFVCILTIRASDFKILDLRIDFPAAHRVPGLAIGCEYTSSRSHNADPPSSPLRVRIVHQQFADRSVSRAAYSEGAHA
jgi:hypothetical protein